MEVPAATQGLQETTTEKHADEQDKQNTAWIKECIHTF